MLLTDDQNQQVKQWVEEGASLSEVQTRMRDELNCQLTFFDVRMLVLELGAQLKDKVAQVNADDVTKAKLPTTETTEVADETLAPGGVSVTVDTLQMPGAIVSGGVVFSDGVKARWMFDQMGRFGFEPELPGYRPTEVDSKTFQQMLQQELSQRGL